MCDTRLMQGENSFCKKKKIGYAYDDGVVGRYEVVYECGLQIVSRRKVSRAPKKIRCPRKAIL